MSTPGLILTQDQLQTAYADNNTRAILPQYHRDLSQTQQGFVGGGDPGTTDDAMNTRGTGFFDKGYKWLNTDDDSIWVCVDSTPLAAEWVKIYPQATPVLQLKDSGTPALPHVGYLNFYQIGNNLWIMNASGIVVSVQTGASGSPSWQRADVSFTGLAYPGFATIATFTGNQVVSAFFWQLSVGTTKVGAMQANNGINLYEIDNTGGQHFDGTCTGIDGAGNTIAASSILSNGNKSTQLNAWSAPGFAPWSFQVNFNGDPSIFGGHYTGGVATLWYLVSTLS